MRRLIEKTADRFGTQADKVKHTAVSALLVLVLYLVLSRVVENGMIANLLALVITLLVGFVKEFVDKYIGGHRSRADMIANLIGAVPMALCIWFFQELLAKTLAAFG